MKTNNQLLKEIANSRHSSLFAKLEAAKLPEDQFYQACTQIADRSFLAYLHACMRERFKCQPFHRVIAALFEYLANPASDVRRLILSAPPRAGKSMLTQYYVAWLCGLNENTAHVFFSYGQRLSTIFMAKVYSILNTAEHKACFPNFTGFNDNSKTLLKGGGLLFGTSVGGAITGISAGSLELNGEVYPGILVADDPLKNGESDAEIEALEPFWVDEANTRRTGNWRQLIIATRFAENDLHGIVLGIDGLWSEENPDGWLYCNLPALCRSPETDILDRQDGESLWEEHPTLNSKSLIRLESNKKHYARFQTVYQGNPTPADGNLVQATDIKQIETGVDWDRVQHKVLAIDSASGSSPGCDNSALTISGIYEGRPVVMDQIAGNWDIIELRKKIKELIVKYSPEIVGIESANTGLVLIPEMKNYPFRFGKACIEVVPLKPTLSKVARFQSVADLIPKTLICNFSGLEEFKRELLAFPKGKKDDRVDSFVWSLILQKPSVPDEEDEGENEWEVMLV